MGNTATRRAREQRNNTTATLVDGKLSSSVVAACAAAAQDDEEGTRNHRSWDNKARKSIANTTTSTTTTATTTAKSSNNTESGGVPAASSSSLSTRKYVTKNAAAGGGGGGEVSAATVTAQRQRQTSVWSLGSLSGRFNWSFRSAGATKASGSSASFHHRPKTLRKSLSSVQLKRSRTTWPRPVTSTIFSTHFKTASRNDEFSIVHLIAKGAFGAVFKVTDKRRRQQQQHHDSGRNQGEADGSEAASASQFYALKVLKKSKVIVEHSVGQLKDEADIQKACGHHSFIVRQIDSWQNRHNLHILSEYLPNGELFSKFATFSLDLVRLYLAEIALAIDFLHHAGIIYRDAKPENILLTQSYHLKLTDFGLSKWLKLGAQTKTMCGTLQYMAPEILRGEPYGHAVDWWSMGVIVCEMLIQRCPDIKTLVSVDLPEGLASQSVDDVDKAAYTPLTLKADESSANRKESQDFLPPEIENLPHSAKDVLKRLLEVDPKKRIHSVMALQRIALYMDFKIEAEYLLNISPLDIIAKDGIVMKERPDEAALDELALKAFQDF